MSGKERLIKEIFTQPQLTKGFIRHKFHDEELEAQYQQMKFKSLKKTKIFVQVILSCYYILNGLISIHNYKHGYYYLVISLIMALFDLILFFFIILKPNIKFNRKYLPMIKFLLNYILFLLYLYKISTENRYNEQSSQIRNFYIQQLILFFVFTFFNSPSIMAYVLVELGYFLLHIYFHVKKVYYDNDGLSQDELAIIKICNPSDRLYVVPEILTCFILFFIYFATMQFEKYQREVFTNIKQTETFTNYFATFINKMETQFISVMKNEILMINTKVVDNLKLNCSEVESANILNLFEKDVLLYTSSDDKNYDNNINNSCRSKSHIIPNAENDDTHVHVKINNKVKKGNIFSNYLSSLKKESDEKVTLLQCMKDIIQIGEQQFNSNIKRNLLNNQFYNFNKLGIFQTEGKDKTYEVFYRFFEIDNSKFTCDVTIDDITNIRLAENISTKTKVQQKLFAKIAHEFKTPIITLVCLVKNMIGVNTSNPEDFKKHFDNIQSLSEYILFLINDIIFCSEKDNFDVLIEDVKLKEIMDFCVGILNALVSIGQGGRSKVNIVSYFDEELLFITVKSDKTRLKQALINFISNSVKFTKQGEIKIEFKFVNNKVVLLLSDTGIGMKEAELDKLRAKDDSPVNINIDKNYNEMGTGLGIRIIKNILTNLKHEFEVDSVFEKGTEFRIIIKEFAYDDTWDVDKQRRGTLTNDDLNRLSLTKAFQLYKEDMEEDLYLNKSNSLRNVNTKRSIRDMSLKESSITAYEMTLPIILLVDDSDTLRTAAHNLLKDTNISKDYKIIEGRDGVDILSEVINDQSQGRRIRMIISDENMEYICGSQAFTIIKNLEKLNKIGKIILVSLTAYVDDESRNTIIRSGADLVLHKPLNKKALIEAYNSLILN